MKFYPGYIPVLLIIFVLVSDCERDTGREFYLSGSGNDEADGSVRKPWKTIQRLNRENLKPGDRVCLEGGSVFFGPLLIDSVYNSAEKNYLTISSYGSGRAVIDGGNSEGIKIRNASGFVIKNLVIKGNGRKDGNIADGVFIESCENFILDTLEVYGFQHSGVNIKDCRNARLTNITAHDNGFAGIHVTSKYANHPEKYGNENIYIGYSVAYNNPGDPTVLKNHSGNGILASSVKGGIIEYCEAYNNGWDMPWTGNGPVGIWIWDCTDFVIQYCVSHDNKTNPVAKDGGGFDLDGGVSNSVIQYCLSYNNMGAGYGLFEFGAAKPWQNNIVRYNISYNDGLLNEGSAAIWKAGKDLTMRNCEIYNNTFINDTLKGASLSLITNCEGFRFTNNIFLYSGSFLLKNQKTENEEFISNCFWNSGGHIDIPEKLLKRNFFTEPGLILPGKISVRSVNRLRDTGSFSLKPQSAIIDFGTKIVAPFGIPFPGTDINGTTVPQGIKPDPEAVEFMIKR